LIGVVGVVGVLTTGVVGVVGLLPDTVNQYLAKSKVLLLSI
jgi:hypothetical protein